MKVRFVKPEWADAESDRGLRVPYAPARRNLARWRWYLILLVVSSPFLFIVGQFVYASLTIQAPGFIEEEQITMRSASQGYVDEIFVKSLDKVREGDQVMRLANPALDAQAAQLRSELQQLQGLVAHPMVGAAREAPVSTESFQDELDNTRRERDRLQLRVRNMQDLVNQGAASEAELNVARTEADQAATHLSELYRTMNIQTQAPLAPHANTVEAQTRILTIKTQLDAVDAQMRSLMVRAPKGGRIVDLSVVKGDQLAIGSKVAMLEPDGGELHVDAYIPPRHSIYAVPGTRARIIFPDGTRRNAAISDVPHIAAEVPKSQGAFLGEAEMGVLVRMQFLDGVTGLRQSATDGLPVRVQFETNWELGDTTRLATRADAYWNAFRGRWAELRQNFF